MNTLSHLKPSIRVSFVNPTSAEDSHSEFGRGVANLCRGVQDQGSLNLAAKSMGMAYSKAWRIIKKTEESFGFPLLIRDGRHGSVLTEECKTLLCAYDEVQAEAERAALESFRKKVR